MPCEGQRWGLSSTCAIRTPKETLAGYESSLPNWGRVRRFPLVLDHAEHAPISTQREAATMIIESLNEPHRTVLACDRWHVVHARWERNLTEAARFSRSVVS